MTIRTGEAIIKLLEAYGTDMVFGIPGTHSIELYRSLESSAITHILPRHEQGAGFMADGYARITNKPGVCFVITGPGVTNIATAMAQAWSDAVPMLVISPVNDEPEDGYARGRLHEVLDQSSVTSAFTLLSCTVSSAEEIPQRIAQAFSLFNTGRPGPVHINIPLSILRGTVAGSWQPELIAAPAQATDKDLATVAQLLTSAENPVIIAGGGCRHFGELVVALAEKIACPVSTTVAGRGVVPGSHPLFPGAQTGVPAIQQFVANADLVMVIGAELSEPDHWTEQFKLPAQQIWINLDTELLEKRGRGCCVAADARLVLPALTAALPMASSRATRQAYQRCKAMRDGVNEGMGPLQQLHWRVLTEIRKTLPHDVTVVSDMTQLAYTAIDYLPLNTSNSWFHPNAYGTLGYALPAAIGACMGDAQCRALVIVGDAGFQYTLPEMAVAAEHNLNIVVLLWQNEALQQISDDMQDAGFKPFAVNQADPDFIELAEIYGWHAFKAGGLFNLSTLLLQAFEEGGPCLIELEQGTV